jgi:shikimate kinase
MKPNIFLTGFMGSGKTTVGYKLAAMANMEFCDLDALIEKTVQLPISRIFEQKGEFWFRQLESRILYEASEGSNKVLATGGGVVLRQANRSKMKSSGIVVALAADIDTIWERLKNSTDRPLISGDNPRKALENLYRQRIALYRDAHFIVEVDGKSPEFLAGEILRLINAVN